MLRNKRWVVLAFAIVGSLLLSSCLSIRNLRASDWSLDDGQESTVTMDLYVSHNHPSGNAYAFALIGRNTDLSDTGRKWDNLNNYGGRTVGVRDNALRDFLTDTVGTLCEIGGTEPADIKSSYKRWAAFRTNWTVSSATLDEDLPLKFRKKFTRNGDAVLGMGQFVIFTGLWFDDGDMVPEVAEVACGSVLTTNFYFNS